MRYQPKYLELQDKSWLEHKYCHEQLSSTAISRIVGCHRTSVVTALRRHSIERRGRAAATRLAVDRKPKRFKHSVLNDKDWLYQKYIVERLSTEQISDLIGIRTFNSIRQALIRHKIKVLNGRESSIVNRVTEGFFLTDFTRQIINGGLLGDAYLRINNKESDVCAPAFCRRNKFLDHVRFVCSELGCQPTRVKSTREKFRDKTYLIHAFSTLTHNCLVPLYKKWYPAANGFKKVVPEDLVLTPTILLHWFLDDGSTSWRNRKYPEGWRQRKEQVRLIFCSESFTKEDNQFLRDQMEDLFDLSCSVTPANSGTGWRVKVLQRDVAKFFEVIGDCPVPSLAYRWKIP